MGGKVPALLKRLLCCTTSFDSPVTKVVAQEFYVVMYQISLCDHEYLDVLVRMVFDEVKV